MACPAQMDFAASAYALRGTHSGTCRSPQTPHAQLRSLHHPIIGSGEAPFRFALCCCPSCGKSYSTPAVFLLFCTRLRPDSATPTYSLRAYTAIGSRGFAGLWPRRPQPGHRLPRSSSAPMPHGDMFWLVHGFVLALDLFTYKTSFTHPDLHSHHSVLVSATAGLVTL